MSSQEAVQNAISRLEADVVVVSLADWEGTPLVESARRLLPSAQSIVVLGMEVYREVLAHMTYTHVVGEPPLSDIYNAHTAYLDGRLNKAAYDVCKASHREGFQALPLHGKGCPTDPRFRRSVFSHKLAAHAANLGVVGKSSLIITPKFGPRLRMACALTEAKLTSTRDGAG